jgi:YHS domain-containing protein
MNAAKLLLACCVSCCCVTLSSYACETGKAKATNASEHVSCEGETTAVAVSETTEECGDCEGETTAVAVSETTEECGDCEGETTAVAVSETTEECGDCEGETTAVAMNVGDHGECAACATKASLTAINDKCPGMGGDVTAGVVSIYNGFTIGYCCEGCIEGFEESPVALKDAFVMQHAKTINSTCPTSGNEINADVVSLFNGFAVGFCCENCQGKFNESSEMEKAATIAEYSKPINTECPISTEETSGKLLVAYRGNVVDFCCDDCVETFADADEATKNEIVLETVGLTMDAESGEIECSECEGNEAAAL